MLSETPVPGLKILENFIPNEMHDSFVRIMQKGIPEENQGHYDGYDFPDNDAFDAVFYPLIQLTFRKIKELNLFNNEKKTLKLGCTLVGYKKDGYISRHIDSSLLCKGDSVVVLSFNSPIVINFYSEKGDQKHHKILIPHKSLYFMSGEARYNWSHEILSHENTYKGKPIKRTNRYAILLFEPGPMYNGELLDY